MFLEKIKFVEDFRCYKKDEEIILKDNLTIITGDNGSGKSTLLSCIRNMYKTKWTVSDDPSGVGKIEISGDGDELGKVQYLDLCSDLYKNSIEFDYDNMNLYLQCMGSSSGEGVIFQLVNLLKTFSKDSDLVIIDEPERGLSIKNQFLISNVINKFATEHPGTQFIVTTHSEAILALKEELWSTTHKSLISSDDYIKWLYS